MLLVCGLCLVNGETWAQARKFASKLHGRSTLVVSRPIVNQKIGDVDTIGLLTKSMPPTEKLNEALHLLLIDNPPRFKGGAVSLERFLQKKLRYPPLLLRTTVDGWIKIRFIVDVDGHVRNPIVYKSLCQPWDDEVL